MKKIIVKTAMALLLLVCLGAPVCATADGRPRVIVTTDGEADDKASMVRFLLTCNEFDVEAIVNSSSEFHWQGGRGWNALQPVGWVRDYIGLYAKVYANLKKHSPLYPEPDSLLARWRVGNVGGVGEDSARTPGAELIARILLDGSDPRPVWVQAWGGCNTLSRALRIIEEEHPDRMGEVAARTRLFLNMGTGRHIPAVHSPALGEIQHHYDNFRPV